MGYVGIVLLVWFVLAVIDSDALWGRAPEDYDEDRGNW